MGNEQSDLLPPGARPEDLLPENWPEDALMEACLFPFDWNFILFLLTMSPEQANYVSEDNCTPLLMVCRFPQVPPLIVRKLIHLNPSALQRKGGLLETTPLSMACERGASNEVIWMLLEADPATACIKDRNERTPIEIARYYGHSRIVLVLLTWVIYKVKHQHPSDPRLGDLQREETASFT